MAAVIQAEDESDPLGLAQYDEVTEGRIATIAERAARFRIERAAIGEMPEIYHQLAAEQLSSADILTSR